MNGDRLGGAGIALSRLSFNSAFQLHARREQQKHRYIAPKSSKITAALQPTALSG
jgi:hypothetical protein